jgi:uncharacterized membrane protein
MSTGPKPEENSKRKPQLFFILGAVSLLVMGFFWSLDSSIVYTLLGIAVFFFLNLSREPGNNNGSNKNKPDLHSKNLKKNF